MSEIAFIALGSNLGDRPAHLRFAREQLALLPVTRVVASTAVEETAPLGDLSQPAYLNQMVAIETDLSPRDLLARLQAIESARGRTRETRWASRTLDLDIVLYDDVRQRDSDLRLPHPGLDDRGFWQRQVAALRLAIATPG
jgi:2-amino-4-hydroxy-6-hydroxymethyldihydropteridine diphosphokinase